MVRACAGFICSSTHAGSFLGQLFSATSTFFGRKVGNLRRTQKRRPYAVVVGLSLQQVCRRAASPHHAGVHTEHTPSEDRQYARHHRQAALYIRAPSTRPHTHAQHNTHAHSHQTWSFNTKTRTMSRRKALAMSTAWFVERSTLCECMCAWIH